MEKKGDAELISIVLLITIVIIIVGILLFLVMNFLGEGEEDIRLQRELQEVDIDIETVEFDQVDNQKMTLVLSKGPGMQILINLTEETVSYNITLVNVTINSTWVLNSTLVNITNSTLVNVTNSTLVTIINSTLINVTNSTLTNGSEVDIVTVNDVSGSMSGDKIDELKDASRSFMIEVLNKTNNKVGLVAYSTDVDDSDCHVLSNDTNSLISTVDSWEDEGWTCICCGINKGIDYLSVSGRTKIMIVMSDGKANYECTPHQYDLTEAPKDAIAAAQDAFENYGIIVYSIGFGSGVDEATLQQIADAGNGSYYFADVSELEEIFSKIQENISWIEEVNISFNQTVNISWEEEINVTFLQEVNISWTDNVNVSWWEQLNETIEENVTVEVYEARERYAYLKVVFYTEDDSYIQEIDIADLPAPLETKEIELELDPAWGITTDDVEKVEIYAVSVNEDGEEVVSSEPVAIWERPSLYSIIRYFFNR